MTDLRSLFQVSALIAFLFSGTASAAATSLPSGVGGPGMPPEAVEIKDGRLNLRARDGITLLMAGDREILRVGVGHEIRIDMTLGVANRDTAATDKAEPARSFPRFVLVAILSNRTDCPVSYRIIDAKSSPARVSRPFSACRRVVGTAVKGEVFTATIPAETNNVVFDYDGATGKIARHVVPKPRPH